MIPGATQTTSPVVWDYVWFQRRYPDLAEWCGPDEASGYFDLAQIFLDNSGGPSTTVNVPGIGICVSRWVGSPVTNIPQRQMLLGLLTAHIASLFGKINGKPARSVVGRISNAVEGSVSVALDFPDRPGAEWYSQTQWGAMFWAATARYRMARYYPGPQPFSQDYSFGGGRGF